mmetsp:Transcript_20525/g.44550  ORF Transcript_20525/g.44550 Transcript_20525/m.44550 type:complete len:750 (+) Transcript_20525:73-2322(+)
MVDSRKNMGRNKGKQRERQVDDGHDHGGGVDINKILESAKNDKPPAPTANKRASVKEHPRKKKEPNNKAKSILSRGQSGIQKKKKNEASVKEEPKDEGKVILSRGQSEMQKKKRNKAENKNEGSVKDTQRDSFDSLKQKLFEATRDLDKEKNTRKMLESKVTSMSLELKNVKEKLGEDKHYCISSLKEELDFEQKLRISVQNDLSKSNDVIVSEQNKIRVLEKDMESEKNAKQSIKNDLKAAKGDLQAEIAGQHSIKTDLSLEKQKTQDLQKRLQYEAAANIAVRMELQSIKRRRDRVDELEKELRLERSATGQCKVEMAEYMAIRMELHAANEKLQNIKHLEKGLKQENIAAKKEQSNAEELTQSLLTLKYKDGKLRKELHETREKLKNERKKTTTLTSQPSQKKCAKRSLSDWVDIAPTSNDQHAGLIPILQSPPSMSMPPPIETSLPGSSVAPSSSPTSSALPSLFHFEEDDVSIVCDKALEPLHDELTFIRSAYDPDEIIIEANKVTHMIELTTGCDSQVISLALIVNIPNNYPASGVVLRVKASIQGSNCSHEVRKCAIDALPSLEEICMMEANANEGREAIHPIFSVASGWAATDWHNILSKELSLSNDNKEEFNGTSAESCVSLIHTHHIIEADRIQSIKKNASKFSLGGFIKIGKPGLILVEGTEADCDQMLDALAHNRKIFHSATFKSGGKVLRKVTDINSCRCLPRKVEELESKHGMGELNIVCEKLGLIQALNDIISH